MTEIQPVNGSYGCTVPEAVDMTNKPTENKYSVFLDKKKKSKKRINAGNKFALKHGMSETDEYRIYHAIKKRCGNPNHPAYKYYGARNIKCEFKTFTDFLTNLGERPSKKHTVDRIDNNKNYKPGNCRWATYYTQSRNKRNNVFYGGEIAKDIESKLGGKSGIVKKRLKRGWTEERATNELSKPLRILRHKGETVREAVARLGKNKYFIYDRLKSGWSVKDAFEIPPKR